MYDYGKSKCRTCDLFNPIEGEGWEDTNNGFCIVYCENGKVRQVGTLDGCACCDFVESMGTKYLQ